MMRAALTLLALCALCLPAAVHAQDGAFTLEAARTALSGFGDMVLRGNCFWDRRDIRPLRIAVAQMQRSTKFEDYEEDAITDRIEEALREDRLFTVLQRRDRLQVDQMWRALGESKSLTADDQLEAIVRISEDTASGRRVRVEAYAYPQCVSPARSIAIGRLDRAPDVPRKFFERAAGKLPERVPERLVAVMPPDIVGFSRSFPVRVMGRRLRDELINAISNLVQTRSSRSVGGAVPPDVQAWREGMDVSGAWQATLRLSRSQQGGVDVRVTFRGPLDAAGGPSGGRADSGYFAPDVLPKDTDPEVIAEAEAVCRSVRQAIDTVTDPDELHALAQKEDCPRLQAELAQKETFHRERVCSEDRARWNEAAHAPVAAMEAAAAAIRCPQVLADAQQDIRQRKEAEAVIARIKAEAGGLGVLSVGEAIERKAAVAGDGPERAWKFQLTEADAVAIELDDLTESLDADLRDSSFAVIAASRQSSPRLKEIASSGMLQPGTYYIRIGPAGGARGSDYTLRIIRGRFDTAGDTPSTARNLGALGLGEQILHERIGGTDRRDIFRFTAKEQGLLQLSAADMKAEVHLDLLNERGIVRSSHAPGRTQRQYVEWAVEAGATYYIVVTPGGENTPYALGIRLAPVAPFSRPEIAAPAAVSATPAVLTHTVAASDAAPASREYYAKFSFRDAAPVSISLTWEDGKTDLDLALFKEEAGRRLLQKRSTSPTPTSESISDRLDPGTYIVRVAHASGAPAPFRLTMISRIPHAARDQAEQLSAGKTRYSLAASENEYWGTFRVTERSRVAVALAWSDPKSDLDLYLVDASGRRMPSPNDRANPEKIDTIVPPGAYWVYVNRAVGNGETPFGLDLAWTAAR